MLVNGEEMCIYISCFCETTVKSQCVLFVACVVVEWIKPDLEGRQKKDRNDERKWKKRGKTRGDQTGTSVKWKRSTRWFASWQSWSITHSKNKCWPKKKKSDLKICPKNLIIGLNLNHTQKHFNKPWLFLLQKHSSSPNPSLSIRWSLKQNLTAWQLLCS